MWKGMYEGVVLLSQKSWGFIMSKGEQAPFQTISSLSSHSSPWDRLACTEPTPKRRSLLNPGAGCEWWYFQSSEDDIFVMDKTGSGKRVTLYQHQPETHALGLWLETLPPFFLSNRLDQRKGLGQLGLVSTQLACSLHQYVCGLLLLFHLFTVSPPTPNVSLNPSSGHDTINTRYAVPCAELADSARD